MGVHVVRCCDVVYRAVLGIFYVNAYSLVPVRLYGGESYPHNKQSTAWENITVMLKLKLRLTHWSIVLAMVHTFGEQTVQERLLQPVINGNKS